MENCRGQAIIEGLMVSVIVLPLFFLLCAGLYFICTDAVIDEFLEMHLHCALENNPNCSQKTFQRIQGLGFKIHDLQESNFPPVHTVWVEGTLLKRWTLKKKRSLFYETSVSNF